jgi:hypothetical protein
MQDKAILSIFPVKKRDALKERKAAFSLTRILF